MSKTEDQKTPEGSVSKEASGLSVFMVEELGAARACHARLKQYIEEALVLVEKSGNRDHFYEVASHIVNGIPDALMGLEQALNSAAMGAARLDYDELKDVIPPRKVDDFEKSLEKVRIRRLTRESKEARTSVPPPIPGSPAVQNKRNPTRDMSTHVKAMTAFNQYVRPRIKYEVGYSLQQHVEATMAEFNRMRRGAKSRFYTPKFDRIKPPEVDMGVWLDRVEEALEAWYSSLQGTIRKASIMNAKEAAERLEKFAAQAETTGGVDSMALAEFVGQLESGKARTASEGLALGESLRGIAASLREGGEEAPSPLTVASVLRRVMAENLTLDQIKSAGENPFEKKDEEEGEEQQEKQAAEEEDDKAARFEEGKPADPTKNMSPEDAAKWKSENEKNKDKFKTASTPENLWKVAGVSYMSSGTTYEQKDVGGLDHYFTPEKQQKNGKWSGKLVTLDPLSRARPKVKKDSVGKNEFRLWDEAKNVPDKVKAVLKTASDPWKE